eukprot:5620186-Alexandrium_andersonii.AAC.1
MTRRASGRVFKAFLRWVLPGWIGEETFLRAEKRIFWSKAIPAAEVSFAASAHTAAELFPP